MTATSGGADDVIRSLESIADGPVEVHSDDHGLHLAAAIPFEYDALDGTVALFVLVAPDNFAVDLAVELHDADFDLLEARADTLGIAWDVDLDEEHEIATLVISHETPRSGREAEDIAGIADRLVGELSSLLELGVIQLVDVSEHDPDFDADVGSVVALKRADAAAAAELLEDLAVRAGALGARAMAAELRIARAEVLTELGSITEALALAEPEWALLGEPVHRAALVSSFAGVLARAGDVDRALRLSRECLDITDERDGRAALLGNIGGMLANLGRRSEAIEWFTAAVTDPFISDADRALHESNLLGLQGRSPAEARFAVDDGDVLRDVDRWIDAAAHALASPDRATRLATVAALTPRLDLLLGEPGLRGTAIQTRLLLMKAQFVVMDDRAHAESLVAQAADIATANGDRAMLDGVADVARLHGFATHVDTASVSDPVDRLTVVTNRVLREVEQRMSTARRADAIAWLDELRPAIDDAEDAIRSYADIRARDNRRRTLRMAYEIAIVASHAAEAPDDALDLLMRLRDSGAPLPGRRGSAADVERDGIEREVAERMRRQPTTLTVGATVRVRTHADSADEVAVATAARAVAGAHAWWWSAQRFGGRLHWALRRPDGRYSSGLRELTPAVDRWLELLHRPGSAGDVVDLHAMASEVLPAQIVEAAQAASLTGIPINVACDLGSDLATIPLELLPMPSGARFLDGARVVMAPPPWAYHRGVAPGTDRRRVGLVLGSDPRLGELRDLVEPIAQRSPVRALGGPAQVHSGTCTALATPASVEQLWSRDESDLGVYYGHIVAGSDAMPLGGGLELCDERGRPTRWTVASMLDTAPGSLTGTVVLAGCASMGLTSTLATEWWGPASGLLWMGATRVIGTRWEVAHGPDNVRFVADIIGHLTRDPADVAGALRAAQLTRLRQHAIGDVVTLGDLPVWSAYAVVGADPT